MQYSIVNYKKVTEIQDFRIDAECFKPIHLQTEELIGRLKHQTIKELAISVINFGAYSLCNYIEFLNEGVPFIVTEDINNNIIDVNNLHFISREVHKILHKSHCKKNQVLLTMAGAYLGQAAVYYLDFEASSNQAIAKITLKENLIDPYYLATFLNCVFGQSQINRFRTGTGQPNLNLGLIQTIAIPLLSDNFQKYIKNIVVEGIHFHNKSNDFYKEAEQFLLSELGLLNWNPKHRLSFVRNFSNTKSSDRIDAEYFQPMYDEVIAKVKEYKNGWGLLGNVLRIKDKNFVPKDDTIYKYIELANISTNGNITGCMRAPGKELPTRARRNVNTGDVIVSSIEGSLSSIAVIADDFNDALCSTGFFVVNSDVINSETLLVLLKSTVGQLQLKKGCSGTILTAIGKDDLSNIVLPKISNQIQKGIRSKIAEMYDAKRMSNSLLDIAKRGVELAIEKNEESAEKWINSEFNKSGVKDARL